MRGKEECCKEERGVQFSEFTFFFLKKQVRKQANELKLSGKMETLKELGHFKPIYQSWIMASMS